MKTVYLAFLTLGVLVLAVSGLSFAADSSGSGQAAESIAKSGVVDAGNKICPVLGEPIDEATKATYEYEGKVYNFCCAGCIDEFKKEPQKYIDKVNQELQSAQTNGAPK